MRDFTPGDHRPPFEQLADVIRDAIRTSELQPGDQLPTRGELTERYGLAPMTVQSALGLVKREGWIVSTKGVGTFVADELPAASLDLHGRIAELERTVAELTKRLDDAGL